MRRATVLLIVILIVGMPCVAQTGTYERTFRQPKSAVEAALKELRPSLAGRLPVLDGFATQAERPLNRYQRGFYQTTVQVSPAASGGTVGNPACTAWTARGAVGPNGAGKSTLLKAVAGLLQVFAGQVRIYGNPVGACHHRVAYLPQRGEIDWRFPISLRRLVMTGRYVHLGWLAGRGSAIGRSLRKCWIVSACATWPSGRLAGSPAASNNGPCWRGAGPGGRAVAARRAAQCGGRRHARRHP